MPVRIRGGKRQPRNIVYKNAAADRLCKLLEEKTETKEMSMCEKLYAMAEYVRRSIEEIRKKIGY